MKKDRILKNSLNVIKKYLKENGPTMNVGSPPTNNVGSNPEKENISGLLKNPPIYSNQRKPAIFRRRSSVQSKQSS